MAGAGLARLQDPAVFWSQDTLEQLRTRAVDGLLALPHRGIEIGGLLLGAVSEQAPYRFWIEEIAPIECEHQQGPGFALSENDRKKLVALLAEIRGCGAHCVVGYYRSRTAPEAGPELDMSDQELIGEFFAEHSHVFLALRPRSVRRCEAALYRRSGGLLVSAGERFELSGQPSPAQVAEAEAPPETRHPDQSPVLERLRHGARSLDYSRWGPPAAAAILAVALIVGWMMHSQERARIEDLAANNIALNGSVAKVQAQLDVVSRRLTTLMESIERTAQTSQPVERQEARATRSRSAAQDRREARRAAPAPSSAAPRPDPRVDQLNTRLAGQEKELASTRDQLALTRQELEGRLGTTKDQLSGPIARTHDELRELESRSERTYYEFNIAKSKEFSQIGPLGLSLRKTDTKRRSYEVKYWFGDQELEKKNVNLFEPILISAPGSTQPLQLVVNEITKDRIRGYISEPKVKQPATRPQPASLQVRQ